MAQGLFDHGANDEKSFGHGRKDLDQDTRQVAQRASRALIKRTTLSDNSFGGTSGDGSNTTGNLDVTIVDTAALGINTDDGFFANSAGDAANTTMYLDNVTANNFNVGVYAANKAIVSMTRSAITENATGASDFSLVPPGAVYTFGDNEIGNVNGALTSASHQ